MRTSSRLEHFLTATTAIAFLAGCSGAGVSPLAASAPAQGGPARQPSKTGGTLSFISDWNNHAVYVLDPQGQLVTTLPVDGPAGIAVDDAHKLYVANDAGSNILVFTPPYTGSAKILSDAGYRPNGVAVDRKGDVAVTSYESNGYGPGSVAFYAKGATNPTKTIVANSKFGGDFYCAFDADGNLYLDSMNGSGPFEAGEVVGGINGKRVDPLTTGNLVRYPGGVAVTKDGKIAILDQSLDTGTATIYSYNSPHGHSLGNPVETTTLASSNNAVAFAFERRSDRFVLTADTFYTVRPKYGKSDHEDQIGQTQLFDYPSGGMVTEVRLPYNAELVGVAVDPPEIP